MNIITHSTAYSLFPRLTFKRRVSHTFSVSPRSTVASHKWPAVRDKYIERGFSFVPTVSDDPEHGSMDRWVGDSHTWTVPLRPSLPHLAADTMATNAFRVVFDSTTGNQIEYEIFERVGLRSTYLTTQKEGAALHALWEAQTAFARCKKERYTFPSRMPSLMC